MIGLAPYRWRQANEALRRQRFARLVRQAHLSLTHCPACTYEEADGVLIAQCADCALADAFACWCLSFDWQGLERNQHEETKP